MSGEGGSPHCMGSGSSVGCVYVAVYVCVFSGSSLQCMCVSVCVYWKLFVV